MTSPLPRECSATELGGQWILRRSCLPRSRFGSRSASSFCLVSLFFRRRLLRSGRPDSNRRRSAWKADALPTELLPQGVWSLMRPAVLWRVMDSNHRRHSRQIYSLLPLAARATLQNYWTFSRSRWENLRGKLELTRGVEPLTTCLQNRCSAIELRQPTPDADRATIFSGDLFDGGGDEDDEATGKKRKAFEKRGIYLAQKDRPRKQEKRQRAPSPESTRNARALRGCARVAQGAQCVKHRSRRRRPMQKKKAMRGQLGAWMCRPLRCVGTEHDP